MMLVVFINGLSNCQGAGVRQNPPKTFPLSPLTENSAVRLSVVSNVLRYS